MMDIAIEQDNGFPVLGSGFEICQCPDGYQGRSCEQCQAAFYRDTLDRTQSPKGSCKPCNCEDNGSCTFNNATRQVQCDAAAPFSVSISGQSVVDARPGEVIEFRCTCDKDQVSITWLSPYNSQISHSDGVLRLENVRPEDSGTYTCTISDGVHVEAKTVQLQINQGNRPMIDEIRPEYLQLNVGPSSRSTILECSVRNALRVSWRKRRGDIGNGIVISGNRLIFPNRIEKIHEGTYVCVAENSYGIEEREASVYVQEGTEPEVGLTVQPQYVDTFYGNEIRLSCYLSGANGHSIFWRKQGDRLPSNAAQKDGILTILEAKDSDSGSYQCVAFDAAGAEVAVAEARVDVGAYTSMPTASISPERTTISQGETLVLKCATSGDPKPSVIWTKVGSQLGLNVQTDGDILRLQNAQVNDRGVYVCSVENAVGSSRSSAVVEVERRERPKIELYPGATQTAIVGGSALFQCRMMAGIPTPDLTWTRIGPDGRERAFGSGIELLSGGVIRINEVRGDEEGQYKCTASNEVGQDSLIGTLVVHERPSVLLDPAGTVEINKGDELLLTCTAKGKPLPQVSWDKLEDYQ